MRYAAVIAMIGFSLAGCKQEAQAPAPVRPVIVIQVEPQTTETFGPFASVVEARYQTQLGFQVTGRMIAREVYVGDVVHKGQRLAALDPTVFRFALDRAKADVEDAKGQLENAAGVESRQRLLAGGGSATQAALDNAVAGRGTAKARLDQALAALSSAQDQVGYTELFASFDGVITVWSAEVGQVLSSGQAIVTVAQAEFRDAVVDIPADLIGKVRPGQTFEARLQSALTTTAAAVVREIGPLADAATRSHRVRLSLEDPPEAFRIGTTIAISHENAIAPRIVIPTKAVLEKDGTRFVWVLAPNGKSVGKRDVVVIETSGERSLVGSGLGAGDKVVTVGVHTLTEGQVVAGEENKGFGRANAEGTHL